MKHHGSADGYSADDIENALNRLASEIAARGAAGKKLLPIFARLEDELAALRSADDLMRKVMSRLSDNRRIEGQGDLL